ncbi:acyl-CoA dehydrogenase family protein [Gordonia sp. NPDC003424]
MKRVGYDDEHEMFRDTVRGFVNRVLRGRHDEMLAEKLVPRDIWTAAAEQGLLGLSIPEQYGGAGADDFRFNAIAAEEICALSLGVGSCFSIHSDVCPPYLVEFGTEEQKQRWLPAMAAGEVICALGMTEPSGGSDVAHLTTSAIRSGDDWVLNGAKTFITNGLQSDLVLVAARTTPDAGARGLTMFAVEAGTPGFVKGRKLDKVGQDESATAELFFADARVPDDNRIGEVDAGFTMMMRMLSKERVISSASNIGQVRQILDETIVYARERRAFGKPIGSFQHNKFLLAELVTEVEVATAYLDTCLTQLVAGELDAIGAAKLKWWVSEVQNRVLDHCVQLHGGYGFMNEYRVARAWKDARVSKIWAGTNEIMKEVIGRELLG